MYSIENDQTQERFNNQYREISKFLQVNADCGYNEHFHWGRLDWMMAHPSLDVDMLPKISLFRDNGNAVVGAAIFDTCYQDRWYILHSVRDEKLLRQMIEHVADIDDTPIIKANHNDLALCELLGVMKFKQQYSESVLAIDLSHNLRYQLPPGFYINEPNTKIDEWQWRLVIHRGFDNDGLPQKHNEETTKAEKLLQRKEYIKTFAIKDGEYVAHCGVWYRGGETAYIEPVATIPEHRGKGLGRAVVYEALKRAKKQGAKRAIVLSEQNFYYRIGMEKSSGIGTFVR